MVTQTQTSTEEKLCQLAADVLAIESRAIQALIPRIGRSFSYACQLIHACSGKVITTGMGKSGHIAKKVAATFASTGTAAFYLHPGEANHGDAGMISRDDVVIAFSNSGETQELISLLPFIKRLGTPLIALCGQADTTLAKESTVWLDVGVHEEACPLGLAPTASTTAALAMGDALAIALLEYRGFSSHDFALRHPGGTLGRRLLLRVQDIMHAGQDLPIVDPDCLLINALVEMSQKKLGIAIILQPDGRLAGVFTDGDLRRALDQKIDVYKTPIKTVMTSNCITIAPQALAAEALQYIEHHKITALVVTDGNRQPIGLIHMHDLLNAGGI